MTFSEVRREVVTNRLPPSRASTTSNLAASISKAPRSKRACALLPPSKTAVRGCGRSAKAAKCWRASISHASSTGFRLPSTCTTLWPCRPSCSGAITRSQWPGSIRGSSICTVLAPRRRNRRVASPPWRPHPMATSGGAASASAKALPNACSAAGPCRGAHQRHGTCEASFQCLAEPLKSRSAPAEVSTSG